ncbi:MAG: Cu(I)-responsive transcriptional regulator [Halobacteriovorax sp.]|nr:Cu(I)-responsive transcriptional regulator [Halobacteriovorax sp.]
MNIGEVASESGVSAKMIRRYEEQGIIGKASRTSSGYRVYSDNDVHILRFVKRSRELGFSMKDIKELVSLWRNKNRQSAKAKSIAKKHIDELTFKRDEIQKMLSTLEHLVHHCHGDNRPSCPIIEDLSSH